MKKQTSKLSWQLNSSDKYLRNKGGRNVSVRFDDYSKDHSLKKSNGNLSDTALDSEGKHYINSDNSRNFNGNHLSDEAGNDSIRKDNARKDLNRGKSTELRKNTENRYKLETKEVQKQLDREKQIERLCLELLKSSYKHELEDLSLETKEDITSASKVRWFIQYFIKFT